MSYYMRYISSDERPLTLSELEAALRTVDGKYSIQRTSGAEHEESGELRYGRALYAVLDIVDGRTDPCEDLAELRSLVEGVEAEGRDRVLQTLQVATHVLVVEVKWQGRSVENTLRRLGPLWDWLKANRRGLSQADGEGFYCGRDLILELDMPAEHRKTTRPCPSCGEPLRTELAKQCFKCGADWHDA